MAKSLITKRWRTLCFFSNTGVLGEGFPIMEMKIREETAMRKSGFTLVEIMIVVAIIGLLAAIAIPSFMRARSTSQQNACINNLRQLSGGEDQYAIENNKVTGDDCTSTDILPYLKKWPVCPASGEYTIDVVGNDPTCNITGHTL